jgi:hypothetical protein
MFGRRFRSPACPPAAGEAEWAALRVLLAEAVILQDSAVELLERVRRERPDPADLATPYSRLKRRFAELRDALAPSDDPELDRYSDALRQIFDHHELLLKMSFQLLAGAERCPALDARLDCRDGLGNPGRRLEAIRLEVLART